MLRGAVLLSLLACPAAGSGGSVQPAGGPGLTLTPYSDGARIETADGRVRAVALPADAGLVGAAGLEDGWIAAGFRHRPEGRTLLLVAETGGSVKQLPAPGDARPRPRSSPALLVDGGRLAGLAWLEGEGLHSLGVRVARWQAGAWSPAEVISPPARGSQLALRGTVLADGAWLLVWTAFDGGDDEVFWTVGRDGLWSPPERLHADNRVPDILPDVAPAGDGALAAWSRYDGNDYRLALAVYRGGAWAEVIVPSAAGASDPGFVAGGLPILLYRSAAPRAWNALELTLDGRPLRRAAAVTDGAARPALVAGAGRLTLRWPLAAQQVSTPWEPLP